MTSRLSIFVFACYLLVSGAVADAQEWLTDQSYRPTAQSGGLPEVPAGLFEPPPPLHPETPPPVFEEVAPPPVVDDEQDDAGWLYSSSLYPGMFNPWSWIPRDGWKNSAELGINGTEGNSQSFSFQTAARMRRKVEKTQFDFRISHNRTQAGGVETQNNALMSADFERFLRESPWTYFVKNGLEYDEFRAFDLRYNVNSGLGYHFFRTDDLSLVGRFGAGASREFGGPDNAWVPEALFGGEYEQQLNPRHRLIAKIDYFPAWTDFRDYRIVSDLAWEYLLDEAGNLSLKLGANDRYDSTPNGRRPNDLNYSALLLYKF